MSRGLVDVALADLEAVLAEVESSRLPCPLQLEMLRSSVHDGAPIVAALGGLDAAGVAGALRAVIAERTHREAPRLELVWTGPEPKVAWTRDTAVVVRHLFKNAERSVWVAGFAFDHADDILRPLHESMHERGVRATLIVDASAEKDVLDRFFVENWPFGDPRPRLYYDPRAFDSTLYSSMHAKCVVADERTTLITSANFTDRGQSRNIELGVLIEDRAFAAKVLVHWQNLIDAGLLASP
jgi:phosphatidylserine/phosphatidylglycerophosphate/cardiolipin synthase-like enzyme